MRGPAGSGQTSEEPLHLIKFNESHHKSVLTTTDEKQVSQMQIGQKHQLRFSREHFLIFDVLFNEFPDLQESLVQMH